MPARLIPGFPPSGPVVHASGGVCDPDAPAVRGPATARGARLAALIALAALAAPALASAQPAGTPAPADTTPPPPPATPAAAPAPAAAAPAAAGDVTPDAAPDAAPAPAAAAPAAPPAPAAAAPAPGQAPPVAGEPATAADEPAADEPAITYRWGGYIKIDGIYNSTGRLDGAGAEFTGAADPADFLLVPGLIPIGGADAGDGGGYNLNARETRFWLETTAETSRGAFKTYVELDFYGFNTGLGDELTTNSSSVRVRHAYGQLGGLLGGQTWSTFMDLATLPENIDFGSPAGRVFSRQAMIRYSHAVGGGTLAVAAESPETTLTTADGARVVRDDDLIPDVVVRYERDAGKAHLAVGAIARTIRGDGVVPMTADTQVGLSMMAAAKLTVFGKDTVRVVGHGGRGIGRYLALGAYTAGTIDDMGQIELIDAFGGILSYQRWWTDTVRTNLTGSYSQALNDMTRAPATVNKSLVSAHVNTIWSPLPSTLVGLELIVARRALESGDDGQLIRIQSAVKYTF